MKNYIKFDHLIGLSAIFIAGCAAYFSILGIGMLFAGSSIAAMTMALSLEFGKLVASSFLYRFWNKTQKFLKIYLVTAVVILMVITSFGIFGYLSAAYQSSSIENQLFEEKVTSVENQKKYSQDVITDAKKRIDNITSLRATQENRLSQLLTNSYIVRNQIELDNVNQQTQDLINQSQKNLESENGKIEKAISDIEKYNNQISDLKLNMGHKKDVITFRFVADALHMDLNTIVKWFISILISVFDPMAVCLLLAYNTAVYKDENETEDGDLPIVIPTSVSPIESDSMVSPSSVNQPIHHLHKHLD